MPDNVINERSLTILLFTGKPILWKNKKVLALLFMKLHH